MVDVPVRDEDARHGPAPVLEVPEDDVRRVPRVDHGRLGATLPRHEIAVGLVGAEGKLNDFEARRPVHAAGPPCFFWYRRHMKFSAIHPIDQKSTNMTAVLASLMAGLTSREVSV